MYNLLIIQTESASMVDHTDDDFDPETANDENAQFWESLGTGGKPLSVEQIRKFALERPITQNDIDYIVGMYPFLDICNADLANVPDNSVKPKIITALHSHWQIHDRGDRLTAGPGRCNFGAFRLNRYNEQGEMLDDDGSGSQWINPEGTIVKQYYDTAVQMIEIAASRWTSAAILGGFRSMQRAAWMAAQTFGFAINYEPTGEDLMIFAALKANGGVKGSGSSSSGSPKPKKR
ncbi:MAG: hypothetical protein KIT27_05225 [Legionellales bacterium]|nr:hypothetical protein [Legionellales bacterium]